MMNLFSIFDPCTSLNYSINWYSMIYCFFFFPNMYWFIPSRMMYFFINIFMFLSMELKVLMNNKINFMNIMMFISLFMLIMTNNFMGLFPYIFTSTSHISINLSFSLILWISIMLFGWINYMNNMFIHLVPQNTPFILMPFMVMIETISNLIRPLTLSVRLTANMIAGHLLMTLISSTGLNLNFILLFFMLMIQNLLIILEMSVSLIQAYVFMILSMLYSNEIF